jgi:hypothetical protein
LAACPLFVLLALVAAACGSNPAQPTAPLTGERELDTFGELIGTNWNGTARFTTDAGEVVSSDASLRFDWGSVCEIPGWCEEGYRAHGWGTTDGMRTRILGYEWRGAFVRRLDLGESLLVVGGTPIASGHWETARVSGRRERLVILSSDLAWGRRRGVTYELTRAPWPSDVPCPRLVSCAFDQ